MKLISVNVGLPKEVPWKGKRILTAIFKEPRAGRIPLRTLNLDGDAQADLSVHGGADKAVYAYPGEHYAWWRRELAVMDLPWGMFGENFTTEGLREDTLHIGDRFRIGSARLVVTQPRMPCFKLAVKFGRDDILKRFLASGRTGFYFAVEQEGDVGAGDSIETAARDHHGVTVADITRLRERQGQRSAPAPRDRGRCPPGELARLLPAPAGQAPRLNRIAAVRAPAARGRQCLGPVSRM